MKGNVGILYIYYYQLKVVKNSTGCLVQNTLMFHYVLKYKIKNCTYYAAIYVFI